MAPWLNDFVTSKASKSARLAVAFSSALLVLAFSLPAVIGNVSDLSQKQDALDVVRQKSAALNKKKAELIQLRELADADKKAVFDSAGGGVHSAEDVAYWNKQLTAWTQMRGVGLFITGQGSSQFDQATKLTIQVGKTPTPERLAETLDFLQLFGWLESYKEGVATLHAK